MFDFASLFTPQRMMEAQQGAQAVNRMPWVFNAYGAPQQAPMAQQQPMTAPVAAQRQASPLQSILGMTPLEPPGILGLMTPEQQGLWGSLLQGYGDPSAPGYINYGD